MDALVCYLTTTIDTLIVGNFLVHRRGGLDVGQAVRKLRISIPTTRKLVVRTVETEPGHRSRVYTLDSTASSHFVAFKLEISRIVYPILAEADGSRTVDELFELHDLTEDKRRKIAIAQLLELWQQRAVIFMP
jgi:carbamoyltransferase